MNKDNKFRFKSETFLLEDLIIRDYTHSNVSDKYNQITYSCIQCPRCHCRVFLIFKNHKGICESCGGRIQVNFPMNMVYYDYMTTETWIDELRKIIERNK